MEELKQKLAELVRRYKYVALVVLFGVLLMLLPTSGDKPEAQIQEANPVQLDIAGQLEQILSQISGVGKVRVMLSISKGEQTLYIYDEDGSASEDSESSRREAVLVTGQDRVQSGLVSQVIGPVYQGAIVVCQGGDQPSVRLQVVEAVCDITGLMADKVSVLKMK